MGRALGVAQQRRALLREPARVYEGARARVLPQECETLLQYVGDRVNVSA